MDVSAILRPSATGSAVGHPVLFDFLAVGLEQHIGATQLADLLLGPLDHAVTLARVGRHHLAGTGNLEALFSARLGLDLGHLALLYGRKREPKARFTGVMLKIERVLRHKPPPRQPFSRAAEGAVYGRRNREKQQPGRAFRTGPGPPRPHSHRPTAPRIHLPIGGTLRSSRSRARSGTGPKL